MNNAMTNAKREINRGRRIRSRLQQVTVECAVDSISTRYPVIDISVSGVRAYCDKSLLAGQRIKVTLFFPDNVEIRCPAKVAWCKPNPLKHLFEVGIAFTQVPLDAALQLRTQLRLLRLHGAVVPRAFPKWLS